MTQEVLLGHLEHLWSQVSWSEDHGRDLRVGIDVVDVSVLSRQLHGNLGQRFSEAVFTAQEVDDCRGRHERLATRWALKEAVSKAIGTGFRSGLRPNMIEVVTSPSGEVHVRAPQGNLWPYGAERWLWATSASHESGMAAAIAVAVATHSTGREGP